MANIININNVSSINATATLEPKFANLAMRDGSKWVYRIPDYLAGKVRIGAKVTVKYPDFEDDRFATVVDTMVSTHLRDDQLGVIVAVIDEEPYVDYLERRKQQKLILQAAEQRKAEVDRMAEFAAVAVNDPEMKAILNALEENAAPASALGNDEVVASVEDGGTVAAPCVLS